MAMNTVQSGSYFVRKLPALALGLHKQIQRKNGVAVLYKFHTVTIDGDIIVRFAGKENARNFDGTIFAE